MFLLMGWQKYYVIALLVVLLGFGAIAWAVLKTPQKVENYYVALISLPEQTTTATSKIVSTTHTSENIPVSTTTQIKARYGFKDWEILLLAQLLCGDATIGGDGEFDFTWHAVQGQPYYEEMAKVLCVVMNRQRSEQFPNTVREVVMQEGQFAVMPKNEISKPAAIAIEKIQEWCEAYDKYDPKAQVIPEDHLYFNSGPDLTNITRSNFK